MINRDIPSRPVLQMIQNIFLHFVTDSHTDIDSILYAVYEWAQMFIKLETMHAI